MTRLLASSRIAVARSATALARSASARSASARSASALAAGVLCASALALSTAALALAAPARAARAIATVRTVAPPATTPRYTEESREAFERQLRAGQVREAEFNKVAEHLHLLLRNGQRMLVVYPGHEEPRIQAQLLHASVPVAIERTTPAATGPVHHKIRYIVAGVLVLALIALTLLLIARRRRLSGLAEPPLDAAE